MTDPHTRHKAARSLGQRAADAMRNGMGSWAFVFVFCLGMAGWAWWNSDIEFNRGFDPYPYIFLNLMLSTLAGLQGAILLIAAKRQDEIAADLARHDFEVNTRALDLIERIAAHIGLEVR